MELATGKLASVDVVIIIVYLAGITALGGFLGRFIKTDRDFFLGGRNLPWWAIGMSIVVSDIGALELVGLAGAAYTYGIAVANFDWIGCIPALVLAAFIFIPFYWRSKVFTIPELLGKRYNQFVRLLVALIWGVVFLFQLGIFFYTAAITMNILCGWPVYFSIILTALVVGLYTYFGGLAAVVYSDAIQCVVLFAGSLIILAIAFFKVGGYSELTASVTSIGAGYEHHFDLLVPADSPTPFGWACVLFGLTFILSPAYWFGNQAIVQRTLGARNEHEAKKSVLLASFLKLFIPVILIAPGLAGIVLHPSLGNGDDIYPTLIHDLLPPGLTGIVFAAFLAALMSSVDSYLNSASTLWTKDIYEKFIMPGRSERHYMLVGRALVLVFVVVGVILAPLTGRFPSIFGYMVTMYSVFQGPLLAILVLGLLWRRANAPGAIAGLFMGVGTSATLFWVQDVLFTCPEPYLYVAWWGFLSGLVATVAVSLVTKPPKGVEKYIIPHYS
ncbi:MAG: sodium/solute symporter [Gemmatimonadota bacterium]|nr:sodium/solute symporter [Gemmatimonadota bacterium]